MGGVLWFLGFGALFYFMMRFGCGAHGSHGHGAHGNHGGEAASASVDPVCGMAVAPDQGYAKMYQGRQYRFCSRNCLDKFEAEPDKYLHPAGGMGGRS